MLWEMAPWSYTEREETCQLEQVGCTADCASKASDVQTEALLDYMRLATLDGAF